MNSLEAYPESLGFASTVIFPPNIGVSTIQDAASKHGAIGGAGLESWLLAGQPVNEFAAQVPGSYVVTITFELSRMGSLRFRAGPISLNVSDEDRDGILVVTDSFSSVYGEGDNEDAAIMDYIGSLVHHFRELEADQAVLSRGLANELARIRRYLVRVRQ